MRKDDTVKRRKRLGKNNEASLSSLLAAPELLPRSRHNAGFHQEAACSSNQRYSGTQTPADRVDRVNVDAAVVRARLRTRDFQSPRERGDVARDTRDTGLLRPYEPLMDLAQANTEESFTDKRDSIVDGRLTPHRVSNDLSRNRGKKSPVSRSIPVSLLLDRSDVFSLVQGYREHRGSSDDDDDRSTFRRCSMKLPLPLRLPPFDPTNLSTRDRKCSS